MSENNVIQMTFSDHHKIKQKSVTRQLKIPTLLEIKSQDIFRTKQQEETSCQHSGDSQPLAYISSINAKLTDGVFCFVF